MRQRVRGFTLLEVLVAVVIISLGMLGVAALLLTVQKADASAYIQQQAVQSAYDILDRMRANLQGTQAGYYAGTFNPPFAAPATNCVGSGNVCTDKQLAKFDTAQWASSDLASLPQGSATIASAASSNGNVDVTVTVNWNDAPAVQSIEQFKSNQQQQNTGVSSARSYTLTTVL